VQRKVPRALMLCIRSYRFMSNPSVAVTCERKHDQDAPSQPRAHAGETIKSAGRTCQIDGGSVVDQDVNGTKRR
jgi:hypothetical protein